MVAGPIDPRFATVRGPISLQKGNDDGVKHFARVEIGIHGQEPWSQATYKCSKQGSMVAWNSFESNINGPCHLKGMPLVFERLEPF